MLPMSKLVRTSRCYRFSWTQPARSEGKDNNRSTNGAGLHSYLTNRKQYVEWNTVSSSLLNVVCGIPHHCIQSCPSVRESTLSSMSLYGLYLRNPSTDTIRFLHMERRYIRAVQRGDHFDFSQKLKKEKKSLKKMWNFLCRLAILMSLYGLYLRNSSTDSILFLHMERTYIGAVQRKVILIFYRKL